MMNRITNGYNCFSGGSWFLIWIVITMAVLLIIKYARNNNLINHNKDDNSLIILKERLAKGEISLDEFENLKGFLMN